MCYGSSYGWYAIRGDKGQMHGIKFIQSKGFYGEDEGKEKVRVYTTALIDFPQDGDEFLKDIARINAGENINSDESEE